MATAEEVDIILRARGHRQAAAALRQMRSEVQAMGGTVRRSTVHMNDASKAGERTYSTWDKVRRANWVMRSSFLGLGISIGFVLKSVTQSAIGFEQQIRRAAAVVSDTGIVNEKQYQAMSKAALQYAKDTKLSNTEAAAGMYKLAAAGFTAEQSIKTLQGTMQLAAATNVDVEKAAEVQAQLLNAFQLDKGDPRSAIRVADVLTRSVNSSALEMENLRQSFKFIAPVSHALGLSLEDTTTALAVLSNTGIKGSQAGTSLRYGLLRMIRPTKMAKEAMNDLGVQVSDFTAPDGSMRQLPEILDLLRSKMNTMGQAKFTGLMKGLVGTNSVTAWVELLKQGDKTWDKMSKKINNAQVTAKKVSDSMNKTVNFAFEQLWGNIQAVAATFLLKYSPAIQAAASKTSDFIWSLQNANSPARKLLRPITRFVWLLMQIAGKVIQDAMPLIGAAILGIYTAIKVLNPVLQFMVDNWDYVKIFIYPLIAGFVALKIALFAMRVPMMIMNGQMAITNFLMMTNPIVLIIAAIVALAAGFYLAYTKVKWFHDGVNAVFGWVKKHWRLIGIMMYGPIFIAVTTIIHHWDTLRGAATKIWSFLSKGWEAIGKGIGVVLDGISNNAVGIIKTVYNAIATAWNAVADVWEPIKDQINNVSPLDDLPSIPKLPGMATGGTVTGSGWSWVGERGPELAYFPSGASVIPMTPASVAPLPDTPKLGGGDQVIHTSVAIDGREVAKAVTRHARSAAARR